MATNEEQQLMAAMAGTNVAFWKSNGELWKLFNKAMDQGYSPERLLAESKNTKWYKTYSESVRRAQALKVQDPAEYRRRVAQTQQAIRTLSAETGVPLTNYSNWAKLAFANQWNEAELRKQIFGGKYHRIMEQRIRRGLESGKLGGELAQMAATIRKAAANNGIRWSTGRMANWMQEVAAGNITVDNILMKMQQEAASTFPGLSEQIKAGTSVRELADSYIQTYAELLELDADQVDLYNTDVRGALNAKDAKGKFSPLSLGDFETRVRQSKKWSKTKNAQDSYMEAAHGVLQSFGVTW